MNARGETPVGARCSVCACVLSSSCECIDHDHQAAPQLTCAGCDAQRGFLTLHENGKAYCEVCSSNVSGVYGIAAVSRLDATDAPDGGRS